MSKLPYFWNNIPFWILFIPFESTCRCTMWWLDGFKLVVSALWLAGLVQSRGVGAEQVKLCWVPVCQHTRHHYPAHRHTHCRIIPAHRHTHCRIIPACRHVHCRIISAWRNVHCRIIPACRHAHCRNIPAWRNVHCRIIPACIHAHCRNIPA